MADFFRASAEYEGIPAFQADDMPMGIGMFDYQPMDFFLGQPRLTGSLADVQFDGLIWSQLQQIGMRQGIVEHRISLSQSFGAADADEVWRAGTGANEGYTG